MVKKIEKYLYELLQIFWNAGCQLVALNFQTLGLCVCIYVCVVGVVVVVTDSEDF